MLYPEKLSSKTEGEINTFLNAWWVSHVAQWLRIHFPMQETQVRSQGREDPLEKETAMHSNTLAKENHMNRGT